MLPCFIYLHPIISIGSTTVPVILPAAVPVFDGAVPNVNIMSDV
jgi:hypothetical protein